MMKRPVILILLVILSAVLTARNLPVNEHGRSPFVDVVKDVRKTVVNIHVESMVAVGNRQFPFNDEFFRFFYPQVPRNRKSVSMGSGFIFRQDGNDVYIITNNHVVEKGVDGDISVSVADLGTYPAEIVGLDPKSDLAVIRINVERTDQVHVATLGHSDDLEIGDWAIAIGNPFGQLGLERTVTVGVISAKGRSNLNFGQDSPVYQDYIQTDAAINPGNSGGPLLNIKGEVIGVNAAITSPAGGNVGIGFAIPIDMARKVVDDIMEYGRVYHAFLGIVPQEMDQDLGKTLGIDHIKGVLVARVEPGTPADEAGLLNGDVIVRINNREVPNVSKFRIMIANSRVGEKISIDVVREGKEKTLYASLVSYPGEEPVARSEDEKPRETTGSIEDLGIEVVSTGSDFASQLGIKAEHGAVISKIEPDSPLSRANLDVGDVILEVNRREISGVKEFQEIMENILSRGSRQNVLFHVMTRVGGYLYVVVTLE